MSKRILIPLLLIFSAVLTHLSAAVNPDGSFSHSLAIEIPPGRQGIQPQLSLTYNSNSPNGIAGVGWSLQGFPVITRMNFGNGIKYNGSDTFVGPEGRLIDVYGDGTIFHAENETWTKYRPLGSDFSTTLNQSNKCGDAACAWEVTDRNGLIYIYGSSNASIGAIDAAEYPINSGAIRVWALKSVKDLSQNSYTITYVTDAGQFYPKLISYTLSSGASNNYAVSFFYDESGRMDRPISFQQSAYVKTNWRLSKIAVDNQTSCFLVLTCSERIKTYQLTYETATLTEVSRLMYWQEIDANHLTPMPIQFVWSNSSTTPFASWTNNFGTGEANGVYSHAFADVNGDGKQDLIQFAKNSAQGWIGLAKNDNIYVWSNSIATGELGGTFRHHFADINGDGKTDLIQMATASANAWIGFAGNENFYIWNNTFGTGEFDGAYRHHFGDINGDGKADLVQMSTGSVTGAIGLSEQNNIYIWSNQVSTGENNGMYRHYIADVNGDGKDDLVQMQINGITGWVGLSNGENFELWSHVISTGESSGNYRHYLIDVNGDGRSDLIQMSTKSCTSYIGLANEKGSFNLWSYVFDTGECNGAYHHHFGDVNGDGIVDLIQVSTTQNQGWVGYGRGDGTFKLWNATFAMGENNGIYRLYFVDISGDGKADLVQMSTQTTQGLVSVSPSLPADKLIQINFPSGLSMAINYNAEANKAHAFCDVPTTCISPDNQMLDITNGMPSGRSQNLVTSIMRTSNADLDGTSGYDSFLTKYEYFNGRTTTGGIVEKTSLGFEKIKTTDVNSGNYKIDTYRQDKPFHGRSVKTASYLANGAKVSETIYPDLEQYTCPSDAGCTQNLQAILLPTQPQQVRSKLTDVSENRTVTRSFEGAKGAEVETMRKEEFIKTFDAWGNPTEIRQYIMANGVSKTTLRSLQYVNPQTAPVRTFGLVYNEKVCLTSFGCATGSADSISETNTYFDDQTNTDSTLNRKLVTMKASYLSTGPGTGVWVSETFTYDALGNLKGKIDAQGIKTEISYDSGYQQYPVSVKKSHNGTSSIVTYDYDFGFGKKTTETNSDDGNVTLYEYDASGFMTLQQTQNGATILAKKKFSHSPFGTQPIWTQECTYYGATFTTPACRKKFVDALGRVYREEFPDLNATSEVTMATERRYISATTTTGKKEYVSKPYIAAYDFVASFAGPNHSNDWTESNFDTMGRPSTTVTYDGKITTTAYKNAATGGLPTSDRADVPVTCTLTTDVNSIQKLACDGIAGKPVVVVEAFGSAQQTKVSYEYNDRGFLAKVKSPQGLTEINYLGYSQLQESIIDPVVGTTSYEYFLTPNQADFTKLKKETRPATISGTVVTDLEYTAAFGRLSKTTKGDSVTNYTYDETDLGYGKGRLTTQEYIAGEYRVLDRYSYNNRGETTNTTRRISFVDTSKALCSNANAIPCLQTFGSTKDELGRTKTMIYPDGKVSTINYMPGSTKNVSSIWHDGTKYAEYTDYTYDIMPHVGKVTYGNGIVHSYNYNPANSTNPEKPAGLIDTVDIRPTNALSPYLHLTFKYEENLNIKRIDDAVIPTLTTEFKYDDLYRLSEATWDPAAIGVKTVRTYHHFDWLSTNAVDDHKGNLWGKDNYRLIYPTGKTYPTSRQIWNPAGAGQWQTIDTYTWSGNGNLLTKGPLTFSYDSNNMLKQAVEVDGSSATVGDTKFFYDQSGQRFLKKHTRNGVTINTWYLGDGLEVREKYVGVTSGTPEGTYDSSQTTKYIYGIDDKKLVSITGNVYTAALSATYDSMMALADGYSSSTVSGLASKAFYTFYGIYAHENFAKTARITTLVALLLMLSIWLVRSHRRSREDGGAVMPLWIRGTALTLVLPVFTLVNCNWLQIPSGVTQGQVNTMISELYTGLPAGTVYYSHNHLGSGNLVTDSAGNELFRITYDEYGQIDLEKSGKFNPATGLIEHNVDAAKILITAVKYTGQEYDPETGLYYYNARYYDPQLGVFTTADTHIPSASTAMSYNRHMYVRGNPILYSDPTGHSWFSDLVETIGKVITATTLAPIADLVVAATAVYSAATKTNLGSNLVNGFNDVSRGVGYGTVGATISSAYSSLGPLGTALVGGFAGGITAANHGDNFWDGFGQGAIGGGLSGLIDPGLAGAIGGTNGALTGTNDIYSRDNLGMEAFLKDSTIALPTTGVGLAYLGYLAVSGAHFERELSRGSNAFIYTDAGKALGPAGLALGNVVGVQASRQHIESQPAKLPNGKTVSGNMYFKFLLRHELSHTWQYRSGGLHALAELALEQASSANPYQVQGTFENQADRYALQSSDNRPWFFVGQDKFY